MANLHVTTTGLRINIETISAEKLEDGKITLAQAQGMSRLIGHSEATKRRCYVLQDTYRSVVNTVQAERALGIRFSDDNRDDGLLNSGDYTNDLDNDNITYNDTDTDNNKSNNMNDANSFNEGDHNSNNINDDIDISEHLPSLNTNLPIVNIVAKHNIPEHASNLIVPRTYTHKQFGELHPDYENDTKRIRFSEEEKRILSQIVENNKINNKVPPNVASRCLKIIWANPHYVKVFHVRHVLSSARLRSCLRILGYVA